MLVEFKIVDLSFFRVVWGLIQASQLVNSS